MKRYIFTISLFILIGYLTPQASEAKLVATYEQSIITIAQIDSGKNILSENDTIFLASSPEVLTQAKALLNNEVRVLYIVMGSKNIITEIQPNVALEFNIPHTPTQPSILPLK